MTEQNLKLNKEITYARDSAAAQFHQIIELKDKEIDKLKQICKDQSSEQGMQLLQMFKTGVSQSTSCKSESPRAASDHDSSTQKDVNQMQKDKNEVTLSPGNNSTVHEL